MKSKSKWLWLVAIIAVGLTAIACDNGEETIGGDQCEICGENICVCIAGTLCKICSEEICECPIDTPIVNKNIEDWELYTSILDMKQEIENYGFAQPTDEDFLEAEEIFQTAIEVYITDENEAAALGEEAKNLFESILNNGWIAYLAPIKTAATTERELAVAERANIASRDIFRSADSLYTQANTDYDNDNYKAAAQGYIEAKEGFTSAREDTEEKRRRAEEAIKAAEEAIKAAEEKGAEGATEAERILP